MHIDISASCMIEADKGIPDRHRDRDDRDRAADRVQAHQPSCPARPHRHQPGQNHEAGDGPRVRPDGEASEEDDTPHDFGRIAATTARQVILQRLRDVGE